MWKFGGSVRNICIRGETGWSTFEEREMRAKLVFVDRIVKGKGRVAEVGRGVLMETGLRTRWWKEVRKMAEKLEMTQLLNMLFLRRLSSRGLRELGMGGVETDKGAVKRRVEEYGRNRWEEGAGDNERLRDYCRWKRELVKEEYADGSDGARVRAMMRGDSLPVKTNRTVQWRGQETGCSCGEEETEEHVLMVCSEFNEQRGKLRDWWRETMPGINLMTGITGLMKIHKRMVNDLLKRVGSIWRAYEKREREGGR